MNAPESMRQRGSIGDILVHRGLIKPSDVLRIIERQREQQVPFGAAAVALGLVSEKDLDAALSSQFEYEYLREDDKSVDPSLIAAYKPFSQAAESLRALRSQLMLRWLHARPLKKSLTIVSHLQGDGRSHIAANLAVVFAQQGQRILLIDADLRKPRQGHLFHIQNSPGLTGYLSGRVGTEVITPMNAVPGLSVLAAGTIAPNPQELVGGPAFAQLLKQVSSDFDVILIDTPAHGQWSDAELVAARSGSALVVARKNKSRLRDTSSLCRHLQDSGVELVGSVLNQY